jgi:ATP-dependent RNA helicase RhlE
MPFSKLNLNTELTQKLIDKGYEKPYPIQQQAIPAILKQKDVLGIAQTGSGKTASFVLPILNKFKQKNTDKNRFVDVLVLVPTRELAAQVDGVFKEFNQVLKYPAVIKAVYGGVSINPQMKSLYGVNILIATPGRLIELVNSKAITLTKVNTLVLDEADKMLNLGFKDEMESILQLLPKKRQNLLFSATLSDKVNEIKQMVLKDPIVLNIKPKEANLDLIVQLAYSVEPERKGPLLRHLIKENDLQQILVFTSSTFKADNVAAKLRKNNIQATAIHSKKSQGARTAALRKFKEGNLRVLVATDLLARGIDIEFLPYVINFELPRSPKDFIHRIGRTGRAENPGKAITFFGSEEEHHFRVIQKKMKKQIEIQDGDKIVLSI